MSYVTTKEELKAAIERKDSEIIVSGKAAEQLKPILKLQKEMSKILPWIAGTGAAAIVAAAPAIPTGGLSLAVLSPVLVAEGVAAGVSISGIMGVLGLVLVFGVVIFALMNNYDVVMRPDGTIYLKANK